MIDLEKKKLELLDKFHALEQKRAEIASQIQRLQTVGSQVVQEMDTLNKQFDFIQELLKSEEVPKEE